MTVALWILTSFLVAAITLIAVGMAIRPYVDQLRAERDGWQARCLEAEGRQAHDGIDSVRVIDPATGLPWTTDEERDSIAVWLKGVGE